MVWRSLPVSTLQSNEITPQGLRTILPLRRVRYRTGTSRHAGYQWGVRDDANQGAT